MCETQLVVKGRSPPQPNTADNLVAGSSAPRITQWDRGSIGFGRGWVLGDDGRGRENASGNKSKQGNAE